jgi:hypothetical protein
MKVFLYSTAGCHLCEQAKLVLWPVLAQYQFRLVEIDIADSDSMIERYGAHIPVLGAPEGRRELNWPFTAEEVDAFFSELMGL